MPAALALDAPILSRLAYLLLLLTISAVGTPQPSPAPSVSTFAPTPNSMAEEGYCQVPLGWNGSFRTPCEFGTDPDGWTFVNTTTGQRVKIQGCALASEVLPFEGQVLAPDDLWCPVMLSGDNEFISPVDAWGRCECNSCRTAPNLRPTGFIANDLCDFGKNKTWSYIGEDRDVVSGLTTCVSIKDFPPLGYKDLGVPEDSLWCPVQLLEGDVYDVEAPGDYPLYWGRCECANTSSPTVAPSQAPTPLPELYCRIEKNDFAPIENTMCNFSDTGSWTYVGSDGMSVQMRGRCVDSDQFPPQTAALMPELEGVAWCPGPSALTDGIYNVSSDVSALNWGVCKCAACSIYEPEPELNLAVVKEGFCGFTNNTRSWVYRDSEGVYHQMYGCASIEQFPPYIGENDLTGIPEDSRVWCPGEIFTAEFNGVYDVNAPIFNQLWGFCKCGMEYTSTPTNSPTETLETDAPTPFIIFPGEDDIYPVCVIVAVPEGNDAVIGEPCGFSKYTGWLYQSNTTNSGAAMFGTVSIGQFPPYYPALDSLPPSAAWCPAGDSLVYVDGLDIYSPEPSESADRTAWGFAQCSLCGIVGSAFTPPGGPCNFGDDPTNVWIYYYDTGDIETSWLAEIVGCASVADYPPLTNSSFPLDALPSGAKWCPGPGALIDNIYFYPTQPDQNDPAYSWGVCQCMTTQPPTPATLAPVPSPTTYGDTHVPTKSPTKRPTRRPSKSPVTSRPSKAPTQKPTKRPTSMRPTRSPGPRTRTALFIQVDYSRSIRRAGAQCKEQTDGQSACWGLIVKFVQHLVSNMTTAYGYDEFRLYLSAYTCYDNVPVDIVLTNPPLTDPGKPGQIENAIKRLASLDPRDMSGTCPSKGALRIADHMQSIARDWPLSYFVVTDGEVNWRDERPYRTGIMRIKEQMRREFDVSVCGATLGKENIANLYANIRSDCIVEASNYAEFASPAFALRAAYAIMGRSDIADVPEEPQQSDEEDVAPTLPPHVFEGSSPTGGSISTTGTVIGTILMSGGFVLAAVIIIRRKRNAKKPRGIIAKATKPKPGHIDWIDNPVYESRDSEDAYNVGDSHSGVAFSNLSPMRTKGSSRLSPTKSSLVTFQHADGTPHPVLSGDLND